MKKILSVVLAVLMCVLPLTANVSAAELYADSATYTFSDAAGFAGDEITVKVTLKADGEFDTIGINNIKYDSDVLTFVKWTFDSDLKDAAMLSNFNKNKMTVTVGLDPESPIDSYDALVGTLTFKINENAPVGETSVYLDDIKDAQLKRGSNLFDVEVVPATVTVKGLDLPAMTFKNKTVTYNSEVQTIEVANVPDYATVAYTVNGEAFDGAEDAGTYDIVATVTAPGYNKEVLEATLEIEPKEITVNAVVSDKEYDGTDAVTGLVGTPAIEGYIEGDDLSINPESLATVKFASKDVGTHAISHSIEVIGSDKDNYEYTVNVPKAAITKRPATITAENKTVKVGDALPELTVVIDGVVDGEALDYTVTTTAKNTNTVKDYPITVKADAKKNPNYAITVTNATLSVIDKTAQEVSVADVADVTYGDEGFKLEVTEGTGTDAAVEYKAETANVSVDAEGNVVILGAGTAKITVSKAGDAEYADFAETVIFTVNKKAVTVIADNKTATKGGNLPELTYTVEGLVGNDTIDATLKTTAKNTNTVKEYPITVTVTVKNYPNYNISTVNGVLSVVDKELQDITVTSNAPSEITYGDDGFKIDVAYGETVTDAETVFASTNENVVAVDAQGNVTVVGAGKATITVSKAGNDTIADFVEEIEIEVAKKPVTITAKDASKKVGSADPVLGYEFDESQLVGDDTISGNVAREEGEEVGTYIIGPGTLAITNSANYDVDFVGGRFTIFDKTPQDIEVTQSYSKTYGDEGFKIDVVYGDENISSEEAEFVSNNEDVATVDAEGNVTIVGAGTAKITVSKAGNADLADFTKTVTVAVAKKAIKVTADAKTKYVDEETPVLTYTTDVELVGDDEFTGELAVNDKNVAGKSYDIKIGTLALNDNYKVTYVGAKLTVLAKVEQQISVSDVDTFVYGEDTGFTVEITYDGEYNTDSAITFESSNEDVAAVDAEGNVTILGAGDARIKVAFEGNNKFYPYEEVIFVTVDKADLDFVIDDQTKKIGTEDPELTYTVDGTLYGDTTVVGEPEREEGEELGTYEIKPGTLSVSDPENYNIGYVYGTLTIVDKEPQTVEVTGIPESVTYGDDGFVISAISAEIADAAVTYVSSDENVLTVDENGNVTIVGAGVAEITTTVEGNDDYADAVIPKAVVVEQKTVTVTSVDLDNKTAVIDGAAETVVLDFEALEITIGEAIDENTSAASVTNLVLTGEGAENYTIDAYTVIEATVKNENLVTVTAVAENGAVEGTGTYLKGSKVTLTAVANKGYKISAWNKGEEKLGSSKTLEITVDEDIELTVVFKKSGSNVVSGGTPTRVVYFQVDEDTTSKVIVDKGDKVEKPEDPTREGFTFEGWYTDEELTAEYDFASKVNASITLYAKWTAVEPDDGDDKTDDGEDKTDDGEDKTEEWENPYTDVDDDEWYYETIKDATIGGIMNGMTETTFEPSTVLTRAMLVTILHRAAETPEADGDVTFEDADLEAYYGDALVWASENGIVLGYNEATFAPDDSITREQLVTIIFRYAVYSGLEVLDLSENLGFEDAEDISEYAVSAMNWAVGKGIVKGYENGTIRPQAGVTRAEAATIIARYLALEA